MYVESEEGLRWYVLGLFAWLGFVAFILTGLFTTIKEAPFIAVPFFGVFLWLAWKGAVKGLSSLGNYMAFGTVRLALERTPVIGGELRGYVEFESTAAAVAKLDATLACTWVMSTTKSNRNAPDPVVVHSESAVLAVHVEPGQRRAPFAFAIPASAPPSGEDERVEKRLDQTPAYTWKLSLNGSHAGGDLERSFVVEVLPAGKTAAEPLSQAPSSASAAALVVANVLALALVLAGLGSVGGLVMLYWAENVVIGFFTVLRMLEAGRGSAGDKAGKTIFFFFHYGMFCLVHGIFVSVFFLSPEQLKAIHAAPQWSGPLLFLQQLFLGAQAMGLFSPSALLLPLLALFASHGVSFYTNYMRNGRYLTARPDDSFWRPYPRMILLHVCIIGGGIAISRYGSSVPLLAVLVVGKTLIDLGLHQRSNRP